MSLHNSTVLMVPPASFQFNPETAASNTFQSETHIIDADIKALNEFNAMVLNLREHGIQVLILKQNKLLPDAVFPNNWFSTHVDSEGNNILMIYPMLAPNRQAEVNINGLTKVFNDAHINVNKIIDLRNNENNVLEGTGSLVLDRDNRLIYAALSTRTSPIMVNKVAGILNYKPIVFNSVDEHFHPVYHTNVILSITRNYVIVCLESIKDSLQKSALLHSFKITKKTIIEITYEQTRHMCGNVLELFNSNGKSQLILSSQAKQHFNTNQLETMQHFSELVPVDIETIETIGGGSARCMMAEIVY